MYSLKHPKKNVCVRKNVIVLITLAIFCVITIIYYMNHLVIFGAITIYDTNQRNVTFVEPYVIRLDAVDNNISCHYIVEGDALPSAEDPSFSPRPNSIFFHETSCRGGLNSRQACAIESASRAHPKRQVYVLFSAPVTDYMYQRSCIAKLRNFSNVRFARVHIADYAKKTPLESMVSSSPFTKSYWRVEHTSDVLRCVTLYKWGGLYLDTDMVVVKSLTPLGHNWVSKEHAGLVNSAAMAFSMDHLGRKIADAVVKYVLSQGSQGYS